MRHFYLYQTIIYMHLVHWLTSILQWDNLKTPSDATLLTLCRWLPLLFTDYIKNWLLSMKKNILHSHHLAENNTETMLAFSFANFTEYNKCAAVYWKYISDKYSLNYILYIFVCLFFSILFIYVLHMLVCMNPTMHSVSLFNVTISLFSLTWDAPE